MKPSNFLSDIKTAYDDFIKKLNSDISLLEEKQKENAELIKRSQELVEKTSDIETVLANKDFFISLDADISEYFDLLDFLKQRDNLDNEGAKEAYEKIVNNEEVVKLSTYPSKLDLELEEIESKIEKIKNAINGDFDDTLELLEQNNYSDEMKSKILLYLVAKKHLIIEDKKEEVKEEKAEQIVEPEVIEQTSIKETSGKFMTKIPEWIEQYNEAYEEYMYMQKDSDELIGKFFGKKYSKNKKDYEEYAEKNEADAVEYLGLTPEETAFVLAIKLFDAKKSINLYLANLSETGEKTKFNYEYAKLLIDEYKLIFDELVKINQKLDETEVEEMDESKVFFAHNENGQLLFSDVKKCSKKLQIFMNKSESGAVERKEAKVNRILGLKKEEKYLDKKIFMLNSLISISYIKINLKEGTGIYVLASGHNDDIKNITGDLVHEYGEQIKEQVELIENQNKDELDRQSSIRKQVKELAEEESHIL